MSPPWAHFLSSRFPLHSSQRGHLLSKIAWLINICNRWVRLCRHISLHICTCVLCAVVNNCMGQHPPVSPVCYCQSASPWTLLLYPAVPLNGLWEFGLELAPSALFTPCFIIHTSTQAAAGTSDLSTQPHKVCCKSGGLGRKNPAPFFSFLPIKLWGFLGWGEVCVSRPSSTRSCSSQISDGNGCLLAIGILKMFICGIPRPLSPFYTGPT